MICIQDYDETLPIVTTAISGGYRVGDRCALLLRPGTRTGAPEPRRRVVHNGFVAHRLEPYVKHPGVALPLNAGRQASLATPHLLCSLAISQSTRRHAPTGGRLPARSSPLPQSPIFKTRWPGRSGPGQSLPWQLACHRVDLAARHRRAVTNVAFLDGHIKALPIHRWMLAIRTQPWK